MRQLICGTNRRGPTAAERSKHSTTLPFLNRLFALTILCTWISELKDHEKPVVSSLGPAIDRLDVDWAEQESHSPVLLTKINLLNLSPEF